MKKELLSAVICCAWKQRESHFLTHQDHLNWPNQPAHACLSFLQELSKAFVYFLLCNPVQLSQVRRTTMFRAPLLATSDENHKKLKARGENNIIRDYFHSSVGFASAPHESQQNSDRLPLDYRFLQPSPLTARLVFFFLILCTITLDLTPTSIVSTSHGSCSRRTGRVIPQRISASWIFEKFLSFLFANRHPRKNIVFIFSARKNTRK